MSRRLPFAVAGFLLAVAPAATAAEVGPPAREPHGIELGARAGAGALVGRMATQWQPGYGYMLLRYAIDHAFVGSVTGDVGYRFGPSLYIGGEVGYGLATASDHFETRTGSLLRVGVTSRAYVAREAGPLAPWLGGSLATTTLAMTSTPDSAGGATSSDVVRGVEVALEAGADTRFGIGPWLSLGAGLVTSARHTDPNESGGRSFAASPDGAGLHAVALLGVRGAFSFAR